MSTEPRRNVQLMLKNKRIGFPDLAFARSVQGGKPYFGARLILDPEDPDVAVIEAAMKEVARWKWKDGADGVYAMCLEKGRLALDKKPYRNKEGKVYAGFEGKYSLGVSAGADKVPGLFDEYGVEYTDEPRSVPTKPRAEAASKFYAGCYAHVKVEIYPLPRDDGNRISCGIMGALFAGDGEPLAGGTGPATADDFTGLTKAKADAEDIL
jgi:hypothetical protein